MHEHVFCVVNHKLLTNYVLHISQITWHVQRAIKNKLHQYIKNSDLLDEVYRSISLLLEKTDEEKLKNFLIELKIFSIIQM